MQIKKTIGVALLGHGKMGRIHSDALKRIEYIYSESNIKVELITVIGQDKKRVKKFSDTYGYKKSTINWADIVNDPEINVFINTGPNDLHYEPTILAASHGKHVFCEKPLARSSQEAFEMLQAVNKKNNNVKHMCGFHFRFIPAIRLMKEIIRSGEIGEILQLRARYLQGWLLFKERTQTWRLDCNRAGTGVLGDLGSHLIDVIHYLLGDFSWISAVTENYWEQRGIIKKQERKLDDVFSAIFQLKNGALGTIEASRLAHGRENHAIIELNGTRESLLFNMERLNEIQISNGDTSATRRGFKTILVTDSKHPFGDKSLGNGHTIGWDYIFVHELHHLLYSVINDREIAPEGATFLDGYRCAEVIDSAISSDLEKRRVIIDYKA